MDETIKASDLAKLMAVVSTAAGLYNELEIHSLGPDNPDVWVEFTKLGDALRELGLSEVPNV